ncbi:MAG: 2-phospho-L-lactate transferase CofD family protein, partial [Candidatus Omnitrophica bacterium]|nr:2-phospho-L-lactate transferase CofD family protein [Candidatus Omnitrophota bacterium]
MGISLGTSFGAGYVDRYAGLTNMVCYLNRMIFRDEGKAHKITGIKGYASEFASSKFVFSKADALGIDLDNPPEELVKRLELKFQANGKIQKAGKLVYAQHLLTEGSVEEREKMRGLFEEMGRNVGEILGNSYYYFDAAGADCVALVGRVTIGKGGELVLEKAREMLEEKYPFAKGLKLWIASDVATSELRAILPRDIKGIEAQNKFIQQFSQGIGAVYLANQRIRNHILSLNDGGGDIQNKLVVQDFILSARFGTWFGRYKNPGNTADFRSKDGGKKGEEAERNTLRDVRDGYPVRAVEYLLNIASEEDIANALTAVENALIKGAAGVRNAELFNREVIRCALKLEDEEKSRRVQMIAGQTLNILKWQKQGVAGAGKLELTLEENRMLKYPADSEGKRKYGLGSYISREEMGSGIAAGEGQPGFFWRGYELTGKLAKTLEAEFVFDEAAYKSDKEKAVLYIMDHGFIAVPEGLKEDTGSGEGQVSTIHSTDFLNDVIPGSYQATSTGVGHLQGTGLDIKQVTEGEGIQFNVRYNAEGRIQEVLGQYLQAGDWTLALPGYADYMVNIGGLRFNDISVNLTKEEAAQISRSVDFRDNGAVKEQFKNADRAPYSVLKINGTNYLIKHAVYAPRVRWLRGPQELMAGSLVDGYRGLEYETLKKLIAEKITGDMKGIESAVSVEKKIDESAVEEQFAQMKWLSQEGVQSIPARKEYVWGGKGNKILRGEDTEKGLPLAEIWFNSTQRDGLSAVSSKVKAGGEEFRIKITLKELLEYYPEMLGGHAVKLFFTKFLNTRFAGRVHMGFSRRIEEDGIEEFIKALQFDRRLAWELKDMIGNGKRAFERFKAAYEVWTTEQSLKGWGLVGERIAEYGWLKEGVSEEAADRKLEDIRARRQKIVKYLNEIILEPGMVIISPVGYPHAIFGLSLQTHPMVGSEAKNEAWIVYPVYGEDGEILTDDQGMAYLILIEPQQTSNTTFTLADFYTPIDYSKDSLKMRKDLSRSKEHGDPEKRVRGEVLAEENAKIEGFVRDGLKAVGTEAGDFILSPELLRESPDGLAKEEVLISGTRGETWPREYFRVNRVRLEGSQKHTVSIKMSAEEDAAHELIVVRGRVEVKGIGSKTIKLGFGQGAEQSVFIPADMRQDYVIEAKETAEVLKLYKPVSAADRVAKAVKLLSDMDVVARVNGQNLVEFIGAPEEMLNYIREYSVVKEPEALKTILQGKLDLLRGRAPPEGMSEKEIEVLYAALFNEELLPEEYKRFTLVGFRGGRGAKVFLKELRLRFPEAVLVMVPSAADDGRSYLLIGNLLRNPGVPDRGKCLLDLGENKTVISILDTRLSGFEELEQVIEMLEGYTRGKNVELPAGAREPIKALWETHYPALLQYDAEHNTHKARDILWYMRVFHYGIEAKIAYMGRETLEEYIVETLARLKADFVENAHLTSKKKCNILEEWDVVIKALGARVNASVNKKWWGDLKSYLEDVEKPTFNFIESAEKLLTDDLTKDELKELLRNVLYVIPEIRFRCKDPWGLPLRTAILNGSDIVHAMDLDESHRTLEELLDITEHKVMLAGKRTYNLITIMTDGTVLVSEDEVNELPKTAEFYAVLLGPRQLKLKEKKAIESKQAKYNDPLAKAQAAVEYILNDIKDFKTFKWDVNKSAVDMVAGAHLVVYFPTTLVSNIGPAAMILGDSIKSTKAPAVHMVNSLEESEPPQTTAASMLENLSRMLAGRQRYTGKPLEGCCAYVTYSMGRTRKYHEGPKYIEFNADAMKKLDISPVALDMDNRDVKEEKDRGLYCPGPAVTGLVQLYLLERLGYRVTPSGGLARKADGGNNKILIQKLQEVKAGEKEIADLLGEVDEVNKKLYDYHRNFEREQLYYITAKSFELLMKDGIPKLQEYLSGFGIKNADGLLKRIKRLRGKSEFKGNENIKNIFVLSRGPIGGDFNITGVLIRKAQNRFPGAQVYLVGKERTLSQIFSDSKITIIDHSYNKNSSFSERIENALTLRGKIAAYYNKDVSIVIDPSSHLLKHGMIPLVEEENYFYFDMVAPEGYKKTLGQLASEWFDTIFGETRVSLTSGVLSPEKEACDEIDEFFGKNPTIEKRNKVAINLGVGGDKFKSLSVDFEVKLITALLNDNSVVFLDRGFGDEKERVKEIAKKVSETLESVDVIEISEKNYSEEIEKSGKLLIISAFKELDLAVFAALIKHSNLYIGYDSMGQHLAARFGIPEITIFGGYVVDKFPQYWRPYTTSPAEQVVFGKKGESKDEDGVFKKVCSAVTKIKQDGRNNKILKVKENIALTKRLILEGATPEVIGTVSGSVSAQNFWQGLLNSTRESFKA